MSPGPSLAIIVKHTLSGGRRSGAIAALTHGLGIGLYALICISGLAFVITASPVLFGSLQWIGAAYLAWLGVKGITSRPDGGSASKQTDRQANSCENALDNERLAARALQDNRSQRNSLFSARSREAARDSFMIVFLNPKIAVFFIALFSQLVGPDTTPLDRSAYVVTALLIDTGWYLLVAWLFSVPVWLAKLQHNAIWFERLFGLILIALAGKLVLSLL
jgi:threonine/homoserine/homoserine lactone efflux protein